MTLPSSLPYVLLVLNGMLAVILTIYSGIKVSYLMNKFLTDGESTLFIAGFFNLWLFSATNLNWCGAKAIDELMEIKSAEITRIRLNLDVELRIYELHSEF